MTAHRSVIVEIGCDGRVSPEEVRSFLGGVPLDRCREDFQEYNMSVADARAAAREEGWRVSRAGGVVRDLCPRHAIDARRTSDYPKEADGE